MSVAYSIDPAAGLFCGPRLTTFCAQLKRATIASEDSPRPLLARLAEPFTAEALFDCLPDVVFFIKNDRGQYIVVNQTLVERCRVRSKRELLGRTTEDVFPGPLGRSYLEQDKKVFRTGVPMLNQVELHVYPSGARGWCLTCKLPLHDADGQVIGLFGFSRDLQATWRDSEQYAPVARAIQHAKAHLAQPLSVRNLASKAGLSVYQLDQRLRKLFHLTTGQLLRKLRIDAAVGQLTYTADPIAKVAIDCGFCDQSAFTRRFKRTTGLTPREFRRMHRR
jgi:AraC-like DNA-binding protein